MKIYFSTTVQWCNVNDFFYLVGYNFILAFIYLFINSSYQHQCQKVKIHQTHLVSKPTSKENTIIRLRIVDDCFFQSYGIISLAIRAISTYYGFWKNLFLSSKEPIFTQNNIKAHDWKPMAILSHQSPWFKLMIHYLYFLQFSLTSEFS